MRVPLLVTVLAIGVIALIWIYRPQPTGQGSASLVNAGAGDPSAGSKLFQLKCSACHSTGRFEQKLVGPGLGKLFSDPTHPKLVTGKAPTKANVTYILEHGYSGLDRSVPGKLSPSLGLMPDRSLNGLSDRDISDLMAYLVGRP